MAEENREEIKRAMEAEEAAEEEKQQDTDAGEEEAAEEAEQAGSQDAECAEAADGEDAEGEGADGAVDGDFVQADTQERQSSFFRKKKDKKDEKIEELNDKVMRQMAEFDNFRKRSEKEKSQMFDLGARSVIEKILPVVDSFERGLAQAEENSEDPFVQGMEKIYRQLMTELESIGVQPIEAEGKEFDPNLHNAVMHCEDESVGENIVVQELQKGYTYHDTVIRHSMVKVAN